MEQGIFTTLADLLRRDPFLVKEDLTPNTVIQSLEKWDSLKHLSLLIELERVFGNGLDALRLTKAKTLGDLAKALSP